jgi:HK97 family phage major capsid protein
MADIQKQLESIENKIDDRLAKAEKAIEEYGEHSDDLTQEVKGLMDDWRDLKEKREKLQETVDEHASKIARMSKGLDQPGGRAKTFSASLQEKFESSEAFKALKEGRTNKASIDIAPFTEKAVMTQGADLTGEVIAPDRVPGVVADPDRPTHVRQFIATGQTTSNTIRYIEETGFANNAAPVAEGTDKPESDIDLEAKDAPVRLVAHTMRVSKQMLDDISYLASYLGQRARYGIRLEEDSQILYGDGTGENLTGLDQSADSAFDNTALGNQFPGNDASDTATEIDVLRYAILQARLAEYPVDVVMLNPADMAALDSLKDADGRYLDAMERLGVTFVENTAVTADDFFVGSFSTGGNVQLFDRMQTTLEVFEQDRDNVLKNLITFRAEERLALPIYRPEGIVHGDFSTALTFA